ncbi:MAG: exosortase F system-associated protein [Bergeyella zoohelcum]|nr:exosortase F system-associated protein [Bergeyella zoohelcum]
MKIISWFLVLIGISGLIGVRVLEDECFYDPFLSYFKEGGARASFPKVEWWRLVVSHLFRFVLNLGFSALVIHFMFRNKVWTAQGILLITMVFGITFPIYLYCVYDEFQMGALFSFYMRRFVIQPLVLLLIIPMFYYRKRLEKSSK